MRSPGRISSTHHATLLDLAQRSLRHGVIQGQALPLTLAQYAPELREPGACFVSLHRHGALRGCIGTIEAFRPLVLDVAANAQAAALRDPRFAPLRSEELEGLELSLHLLSVPEPVPFDSLPTLYAALRPGVDGLVLELGSRRGVFLPVMWESLHRPQDFVAALLRKAGIAKDADLTALRASRFVVQCLPEPVQAR